MSELLSRAERLEEAFLYDRSIDRAVYERQRDRLQEELAIAELELHDACIDETEIEGLLAFAEHLITNIGRVWLEASLAQRQQIQRTIFPEGLPFDGERFGTAATCLVFSTLERSRGAENGMASPPGFEPSWNSISAHIPGRVTAA